MPSGKINKRELQLSIVNIIPGSESFYKSLYGSLKYYISENTASKDEYENIDLAKTLVYPDISGTGDCTEENFVRYLRKYVVNEVRSSKLLFQTLKDSFYTLDAASQTFSKNPSPDVYNNWYNNTPSEVKQKFRDFERDYVNANPKDQPEYKPTEDQFTLKNRFNNNLADTIEKKIYSFDTDINILKMLLDRLNITLIINDDSVKPSAKDLLNVSPKKHIYLCKDKGSKNYKYYSLFSTAGSPENYSKGLPGLTYNKQLANLKDEFKAYGKDQITDTVDYFQLGMNRYKQYFDKYTYEQQIYANQRVIDKDANMLTSVDTKIGETAQTMKNELIKVTIEKYYVVKQIEVSLKDTMETLKDIIVQKDKLISDILIHNNDLLVGDNKVTIQTLLLIVQSSSEDLKYNLTKTSQDIGFSREEGTISLLSSMKKNEQAVGALIDAMRKANITNSQVIFDTLMKQITLTEELGEKIITIAKELKTGFDAVITALNKLGQDYHGLLDSLGSWTTANLNTIIARLNQTNSGSAYVNGYAIPVTVTGYGLTQPTQLTLVAPTAAALVSITTPTETKYLPAVYTYTDTPSCPATIEEDKLIEWYKAFLETL
jgi:hypothetical protein